MDWVFSVGLALLWFYVGYRLGKQSVKKPKEKDSSICSCTHQYSMHDDTNKCKVVYIKRMNSVEREFRCACVRYDGIPPAHVYMKDV